MRATWKGGRVVVDDTTAVDWPEGCELVVQPMPVHVSEDDIESSDPAAIARWVAEFDRIPPVEFTAEEEHAWQTARQTQREFELRTFQQRAEQIERALR